jgi:ferredoxin-thioredoxin reductase catalytic subunit
MITILRKEGWVLNPNDKTVNSILKMVENNAGKCPCYNTSADTECPCSDYRLNDKCHCGLYLKIDK